VPQRDEMAVWLGERGVGTGIHYKNPGHLQPALQHHAHRAGDMKVTSEACRQLISLPMYPELTDEQVAYVAGRVKEFLANAG
jgi:dTDP-4-amino-4,6-dideoxygalactose transaminase